MSIPDTKLVDLFISLVKVDAPSGAELPVANFIKEYFCCQDVECYTDNAHELTGGNSGNVIVEYKGGGDLFLAAHMDTPRATLGVSPQLLEDRITSDGNTILGVDNRGGLSAILFAAKRAIEEKSAKPFTLLFTVCEETTLGGSLYYAPKEQIKYGYVFDSHMRPGNYVSGTCGLVRLEFEFKGRSAHAGISPEKGVNAIQIGSKAIASFPFGWINEETNANIGIIKSGNATNVVSDQLTAIGELRSDSIEFATEKIDSIVKEFRAIAEGMGGSVEFFSEWEFTPYKVDHNHEGYLLLERVFRSLKLSPLGVKSMGGSDANSFNAKGINTINIGVGAQNPHGNDEFILYQDLHTSYMIAYHLLTM